MMKASPLDKDFPVEIDKKNSPMFHDLVQHWEGIAETVVDMEQHYYAEIIHETTTRRTVVKIEATSSKLQMKTDEELRRTAGERYVFGGTGSFEGTISDTVKTAELFKMPVTPDDIDSTVTIIEKAWIEESRRRGRWHRTRLFFRLVWASYKEARQA